MPRPTFVCLELPANKAHEMLELLFWQLSSHVKSNDEGKYHKFTNSNSARARGNTNQQLLFLHTTFAGLRHTIYFLEIPL